MDAFLVLKVEEISSQTPWSKNKQTAMAHDLFGWSAFP